jgi:hypothetical protein
VSTGAGCDDGDDCTVDDTCGVDGECAGEVTFCCDPVNAEPECNFSYAGLVEAPSTATYSGGLCGGATKTGGLAAMCLPDPPAGQSLQVCVDFPTGAGTGYALGDYSPLPDPTLCTYIVPEATCATVATPPGIPNWAFVAHANSGSPEARVHVRCLPTATSCASSLPLTCDTPAHCTSGSWTSGVDDYGATCGNGFTGKHMSFKQTFAEPGDHTVWLSGASVASLHVMVGPATSGTCNAAAAVNCEYSGPAPLHFVTTAPDEAVCIWIEKDPSLGTDPEIAVSTSCYAPLP